MRGSIKASGGIEHPFNSKYHGTRYSGDNSITKGDVPDESLSLLEGSSGVLSIEMLSLRVKRPNRIRSDDASVAQIYAYRPINSDKYPVTLKGTRDK